MSHGLKVDDDRPPFAPRGYVEVPAAVPVLMAVAVVASMLPAARAAGTDVIRALLSE